MSNRNCLNCEREVTENFCPACGQKTDTHRITFRNLVYHDLLHGAFHIEKGMLFTARQAFTQPGRSALEYIAGKRKRYYNVFLLVLFTIGAMLFIKNINRYEVPEAEAAKAYINEASRRLDEIFSHKSKLVLLLFVPVSALSSLILFRRKGLNLSEHSIISGTILLGLLLVNIIGQLSFYLGAAMGMDGEFMSWTIIAANFVYIGYGYWNAFHADYTKAGTAWRIVAYFLLFFLQVVILMYLLVGYVTDWEFGEIQISPFS